MVSHEKATWMTWGTMWPPISWIGLWATSAAKLSLARVWHRPQVSLRDAAETAEAGSVFDTIAWLPPCSFFAAWQLVQTGAYSLPTRASRPCMESW